MVGHCPPHSTTYIDYRSLQMTDFLSPLSKLLLGVCIFKFISTVTRTIFKMTCMTLVGSLLLIVFQTDQISYQIHITSSLVEQKQLKRRQA